MVISCGLIRTDERPYPIEWEDHRSVDYEEIDDYDIAVNDDPLS